MKRILGVLLLTGGIVTTSNAQKINATKIPAVVKASFTKLHPGIKVIWEIENEAYEAGFTFQGKKTSEVYSENGLLLETEVEIKKSELPSIVLAKLKGIKVAEAAKITKANGTVNYEAEVKGKDLLFDSNGNSLKP